MKNKYHIAVENIVRKGEIACHKQFLLFSQCFPQLYIFSTSKCGIVWKWVNHSSNKPLFSHVFSTSCLITCVKGRNCLYQTISLFFSPSVIYPLEELSPIFIKFEIVICKLFHLEELKICCLGKNNPSTKEQNFRLVQLQSI